MVTGFGMERRAQASSFESSQPLSLRHQMPGLTQVQFGPLFIFIVFLLLPESSP
jgi:hypothetical protein